MPGITIRSTLSTVPPSIHGARDYRELARLGLKPNDVIDFSNNSNPYGPHSAVLEAVKQAVTASTLTRYPDRHCLELTEAIAVAEDVSPDCILLTNGASELIQLIALAFVLPQSRHLILAPTFGEYSRAIHLMGGTVIEVRPASATLRFDEDTIAHAIKTHHPDAVWLCNPNNPTGQQWGDEVLASLRAIDSSNQALWVFDESYRYFSSQWSNVGCKPLPNTIIIRSLTKEHGLAGLRLGYAVAPSEIITALQTTQPPWSVNSLAQVAGVAALRPEVTAWRGEILARLHQHAHDLWAGIATLGYNVLPSSTPFALVEVGNAAQFRQKLLQQGVLVRDCTSFGLPEFVRIAARLPEENETLLMAIKSLDRSKKVNKRNNVCHRS